MRQPRPVVGEEDLVELIGGKIEKHEKLIEAAERELVEEAGLRATVLDRLAAPLFSSPGFLGERTYQFLATGLSAVQRREEDLHIRPWWVGLDEAVGQALAGRLRNAGASRAVLHVGSSTTEAD